MPLERSQDEILNYAKNKIKMIIRDNGPYTHSMISMVLQDVHQKLGTKFANQLVDEFELEQKFGITKSGE